MDTRHWMGYGRPAGVMEAWRRSDHVLAMQEANAPTVLGDFLDAQCTTAGITSTFAQSAWSSGRFLFAMGWDRCVVAQSCPLGGACPALTSARGLLAIATPAVAT